MNYEIKMLLKLIIELNFILYWLKFNAKVIIIAK